MMHSFTIIVLKLQSCCFGHFLLEGLHSERTNRPAASLHFYTLMLVSDVVVSFFYYCQCLDTSTSNSWSLLMLSVGQKLKYFGSTALENIYSSRRRNRANNRTMNSNQPSPYSPPLEQKVVQPLVLQAEEQLLPWSSGLCVQQDCRCSGHLFIFSWSQRYISFLHGWITKEFDIKDPQIQAMKVWTEEEEQEELLRELAEGLRDFHTAVINLHVTEKIKTANIQYLFMRTY